MIEYWYVILILSQSNFLCCVQVLGDGKVFEFDRPDVLLSNDDSHFTALVNQTGIGEADYLRNLVKMK